MVCRQGFLCSIKAYCPKSPFRLYASVHTKQRTVNAVQIIKHFFMNDGQFLVQPNNPISLTLTAFLL